MSQTLADLRRKLTGANQLQSVVRTMKAMAASSIGQYQAAVHSLAGYQACLEQGLGVCFRQLHAEPERKTGGVGAIVFGSDQGLMGRFNESLCAFVVDQLAALPGPQVVWAVGERMQAQLLAAGISVRRRFAVPHSVTAITPFVGEMQWESEECRNRGEYSQLYLFHNRPEAAGQRLLPLDPSWRGELAQVGWPGQNLPQLLNEAEQTVAALVREYLFIAVYRACAESLASENGPPGGHAARREKY